MTSSTHKRPTARQTQNLAVDVGEELLSQKEEVHKITVLDIAFILFDKKLGTIGECSVSSHNIGPSSLLEGFGFGPDSDLGCVPT